MWGERTDTAAQTAALSSALSLMVQQVARMTVADLPRTSHPQLLLVVSSATDTSWEMFPSCGSWSRVVASTVTPS